MSPEERSLILALVKVPGGPEPLAGDEFLRQFCASDGLALGLDLLRDAIDHHDPVDVALAMVVCYTFGFSDDHLEVLITLAFADWHQSHEDVASALGDLGSPSATAALFHLADWVPSYLEFDDAQALAVKAIWGLGSIRSDDAHHALESLTQSKSKIVAENALAQLQG